MEIRDTIKLNFGPVTHCDKRHQDNNCDICYEIRYDIYRNNPNEPVGWTQSNRQVYLAIRPKFWIAKKKKIQQDQIQYQADQQVFINYDP